MIIQHFSEYWVFYFLFALTATFLAVQHFSTMSKDTSGYSDAELSAYWRAGLSGAVRRLAFNSVLLCVLCFAFLPERGLVELPAAVALITILAAGIIWHGFVISQQVKMGWPQASQTKVAKRLIKRSAPYAIKRKPGELFGENGAVLK